MNSFNEIFESEAGLLKEFINYNDKEFDNIQGNFLLNTRNINLLKYVNRVLNDFLNECPQNSDIKLFHLIISGSENVRSDLLKYFIIKFFYTGIKSDTRIDNNLKFIKKYHQKKYHEHILKEVSVKASFHRHNRWKKEKQDLENLNKFLLTMEDESLDLNLQTIFNCFQKDKEFLLQELNNDWLAFDINKKIKKTYIGLNSNYSYEELLEKLSKDTTNSYNTLHNVILFDSSIRKTFKDYSFHTLERINNEIQTHPIRNYIIVDFDLDKRLCNVLKKKRVAEQYYFRKDQIRSNYYINNCEVQLLKNKNNKVPNIFWYGEESNIYYNEFQEQLLTFSLEKYLSIRYRNIFLLCIIDKFRILIRKELSMELTNNKDAILNCFDKFVEDIQKMKNQIFHQIDIIAKSNVVSIVVDDRLYEHKEWVYDEVILSQRYQLYPFSKLNTIANNIIIILGYRDAGNSPFRFYPNILEGSNKQFNFIAVRFMHFNRYKYFCYIYNKKFMELHNSKTRVKYLGFNNIKSKVQGLHNEYKSYDNLYSEDYTHSSETFTMTFYSQIQHTYSPAALFLINSNENYNILRIDELFSDPNYQQYSVQALEELYSHIGIFEITKEQEAELTKIKTQFGLNDENIELWKYLLNKIILDERFSPRDLYRKIFTGYPYQSEVIRFEYFKDNWLNINSELMIPRRKRIFRYICEQLSLPSDYYRLMLKKRAIKNKESKETTLKLQDLTIKVIEDKMYLKDYDWSKFPIEEFYNEYDLEEYGILLENTKEEIEKISSIILSNIRLKKIINIIKNDK